MTTVHCGIEHVNSVHVQLLSHTADDEAALLAVELAEAEWDAHLEGLADLLAEESRWQDSLESLDPGLSPEETHQALGLRLVVA